MMTIKERAVAIRRAQAALKTLSEQPMASQRQLGVAREQLNDCYRLSDPERVRAAADRAESTAATVRGPSV